MRAGRRRKVEMAVARGVQADVFTQGRRRQTRLDSDRGGEFVCADAGRRAATYVLRSRTAAGGRARAAATGSASSGPAAACATTRFARRGTIFLCVRLKETLT